jgi:oxaloacetate decarboxylase
MENRMTPDTRRARLRALLAGDKCVYPASVFDPLSGRIAQEIGFEVGMLAGSVASLTVLGDPDLTLITLTELAEQTRRICRACTLPLLVDADHGYGNALNARRTVVELEAAGVAGLTIEDSDLPRAFAVSAEPRAISIAAAVGKLEAALDARGDERLVVVGRTSVAFAGGIEDCLARVRAYSRTGVDAIFVSGVRDRTALDAIASTTTLPLILGGAGREVDDPEYLNSRHVRLCLRGHGPFQAAVAAVRQALVAQRGGDPLPNGAPPGELIEHLSGAAVFEALEKRFLQRS